MRQLLAAALMAVSLAPGLALADDEGGSGDGRFEGAAGLQPATAYSSIATETSSSTGGILVPLILLVLIAAAASG